MMKFIVPLVLSMTRPLAFGYGGDVVNNGGGLAEKNISFAYANLAQYLSSCLNFELCHLSKEEREILSRINQNLPNEYKSSAPIVFKSEFKEPGFFLVDGEIKVAKTGSKVGDTIFFNIDLLYHKNFLGYYNAISLADAVSFLVHELGHHANVVEHAKLDLLGAKVSSLLQKKILQSPLFPQFDNVSVIVMNGQSSDSRPTILLYVYNDVIDISDRVSRALKCHGSVIPFPDPSRTIAGFLLHNLHWKSIGGGDSESIKFVLVMNNTKICAKGDDLNSSEKEYELNVSFEIAKDSEISWKYAADSLHISEDRCSWWGLPRFPF